MLIWHDAAWADYLGWQMEDRKTLRRINALIKDIARNAYEGIGKPEALTGNLSGFWSRRIDDKNRLLYRLEGNDCLIAQCKGHYDDS
ncbi:MAG: Txe/YoeB family addiction module toxin [Zoogloeaceae bacterium]|nr:Txe/YoeB family addiction module toxin [Zoogloeaceae bacterium]